MTTPAESIDRTRRGAIAWATRHPIAANLMMLALLVGGIIFAFLIKREVFPATELDLVTISVAYPGATPAEVEQGIVLAIEEKIRDIDGIEKITSTAREGSAQVVAELRQGAERQQIYQDVQQRVSNITTFPVDIERPVVSISSRERRVLTVMLYGGVDDWVLRSQAELLRDLFLQNPGITRLDLDGIRTYEVKIQPRREALERYGLTLQDIAAVVGKQSVELSGGSIKSAGGEILLRLNERRQYAANFARLPLLHGENGAVVRVGDVADVRDGFDETDALMTYNGKPAIAFEIYRVGDQSPSSVSEAVRRVLDEYRASAPPGIATAITGDMSEVFGQRLDLLMKNAAMGLALVVVLLGAFLEFRLAFWVALGIPTSFLGSLIFLPAMGVSINMVSMFAFIIALGIVVDDAIIVGENVYEYRKRGMSYLEAAIRGAQDMAVPVSYAIATNIVAFMPLLLIPGVMGKLFGVISLVVSTVFAISWIESLIILPHHLAWSKKGHDSRIAHFLYEHQQRIANGLDDLVERWYKPSLIFALRHRYITVAAGVAGLMVVIAFAQSGRLGFTMMPVVESDRAVAEARLPVGATPAETKAVQDRLIQAGLAVVKANPGDLLEGYRGKITDNQVQVTFYLQGAEIRPVSTAEFNRQWRKRAGKPAGVDALSFKSDIGGPGGGRAELTVELSHRDTEVLQRASATLAEAMRGIAGTRDVEDGFTPGKREYTLALTSLGQSLGLSASEVARQVRSAFYGAQALRQQRGRNEIKVMVRLPREERESLYDLYQLKIKTPAGGYVPLKEVAELVPGHSYTVITRRDGRRTVNVQANVEPIKALPQVIQTLDNDILPDLKAHFPGLGVEYQGKQADTDKSMKGIAMGFVMVLLFIYILLALPLESYTQPLIVMAAIPFGFVGAILGHWLMGFGLSVISFMGILALTGVVINDSLVLMDYSNHQRKEGATAFDAIVAAGTRRFRPIMLTTVTTFGGLAPMIFETSIQARFIIPMAISLGYGIVFATIVTLAIIPALYLIQEDARTFFGRKPERMLEET